MHEAKLSLKAERKLPEPLLTEIQNNAARRQCRDGSELQYDSELKGELGIAPFALVENGAPDRAAPAGSQFSPSSSRPSAERTSRTLSKGIVPEGRPQA